MQVTQKSTQQRYTVLRPLFLSGANVLAVDGSGLLQVSRIKIYPRSPTKCRELLWAELLRPSGHPEPCTVEHERESRIFALGPGSVSSCHTRTLAALLKQLARLSTARISPLNSGSALVRRDTIWLPRNHPPADSDTRLPECHRPFKYNSASQTIICRPAALVSTGKNEPSSATREALQRQPEVRLLGRRQSPGAQELFYVTYSVETACRRTLRTT